MKNRQYQGVQLSKKESELITWLQKGEHNWIDAFGIEGKKICDLIAAAPELLEALERALNDFKNQSWTDATYDLIESTISKAKGL